MIEITDPATSQVPNIATDTVPPAPSTPPAEMPPAKPKKNLLPILLALLVSAGVFGYLGYYFGQQTANQQASNTKQANTEQVNPSLSVTVTSQPTISPTVASSTVSASSAAKVALTTYTSKFEKFSFAYPSNWQSTAPKQESNFPEADTLGIQDPKKLVNINWISAIDGLGGSCDPNIPFTETEGEMGAPCPSYEVVEKEKLENADLYYVAYVVTNDGVNYRASFALQDANGLLVSKRAMAYMFFQGKNNGKVSAGLYGGSTETKMSKEAATAFFSTPEATQAKGVLMSGRW